MTAPSIPAGTLLRVSSFILPPPPRRRRRPTMTLRAVMLPPPCDEVDDVAGEQTLATQLDHEPEGA